ncbi:hypothetical protein A2242_03430 [Candidatus Falkowbacteria bacterium RIFOXYA2_FULL_47_9]|uniref:phosphoribosylglycinamide formyltransferase 1 n=1 Tax=Candidatus Falkowbacteria bacterium RIFOXYA2_FULL_47_9 TaxID=1797995 RepID=A0A1F5SNI6_9BACT|nr:MAG: hypothetical protein A2242_03430 [Candidatus Falkowbacteria bacterium RIFOXYA2_FULL_47_9]
MRIALLISGGGTTAGAIITACKNGQLPNIAPVLVIASKAGIGGIERVKAAGMLEKNIVVIEPKKFPTPHDFGEAILKECEQRGVEFIGQYGWLALTPSNVIARYEGMMTNQHPGPLDIGRPDFGGSGMYGKRVHAARICFVKKTNRDFWSEATAQRVAVRFDEGAVLKTRRVPIVPGDTPETLAARLLPLEHEVHIATLQDFADNTVKEIKRDTPLVLPGEEDTLEECKRQAIAAYPNG